MIFGREFYTKEQRQALEQRSAAFSEARDAYNRRLWDVTELLARYGREKRAVYEALERLPQGSRSGYCSQILERYRFLCGEGRPLEKNGLTGVKLREWSQRDLSFPDTAGLKPQEACGIYDRLTGTLREDTAELETIPGPLESWSACAEGLRRELATRIAVQAKVVPVENLLSLFLDVEIFVREDGGVRFRRQELEQASEAISAALAKTGRAE